MAVAGHTNHQWQDIPTIGPQCSRRSYNEDTLGLSPHLTPHQPVTAGTAYRACTERVVWPQVPSPWHPRGPIF